MSEPLPTAPTDDARSAIHAELTRSAARRGRAASGAVIIVAIALALVHGMRARAPSVAEIATWNTLAFAVAGLLGVVGAFARAPRRASVATALATLALLGGVLGGTTASVDPTGLHPQCLLFTGAGSAAAFVLASLATGDGWRRFPSPLWAAVVASGAMVLAAMSRACPHTDAVHLLLTHVGGVAVVATLARAFSRVVLGAR
jgi:hypothetical protein